MDIVYTRGDATAPAGESNKIIVHVCNDIGAWGKGFVRALSARWKEPEKAYRKWYKSNEGFGLGEVLFVQVTADTWVANMIGQRDIRKGTGGMPPIRYEAIRSSLQKVANFAIERSLSVHMPRIGCGLAGGTWDVMEGIIIETLTGRGVPVTVYDL